MTTSKEDINKERPHKERADSVNKAKRPKDGPIQYVNTIKFNGWNQSADEVVITLSAGKRLSANDIDATFTENSCKVTLTDGRRYQCHLNQSIKNTSSKIQTKGMRIMLRMKKAQEGVTWESLEFIPVKAPPKPNVAHAAKRKVSKSPHHSPPPAPSQSSAKAEKKPNGTVKADTPPPTDKAPTPPKVAAKAPTPPKVAPKTPPPPKVAPKAATPPKVAPKADSPAKPAEKAEASSSKPPIVTQTATVTQSTAAAKTEVSDAVGKAKAKENEDGAVKSSRQEAEKTVASASVSNVAESKQTKDSEAKSSDNGEKKEQEQSEQENEEDLYYVDRVKNDFFEKSTTGPQDTLVLHMYVKQLRQEAINVSFQERQVTAIFQTDETKFLDQYAGTTGDTRFCWRIKVIDALKPELCRFHSSHAMIVITMHKAEGRRWGRFEEILEKEEHTEVFAKWVSAANKNLEAKSSTAAAAAKPAAPRAADTSKRVAFDEFSLNTGSSKASGDWFDRDGPSTSKEGESRGYGPQQKPMCMVSPLHKAAPPAVKPGFTGLDNLGNTCFMNSVLQVLANTPRLRDYFLDGDFQREINHDNPLGTGGRLAVAFATLLKVLWSGKRTSYAPANLKNLVALKSSQFSGYAQHDAQEFLAFLLDGLHEDVNRIRDKPYTSTVEADGKPDRQVAEEAWSVHRQRNDSLVVDMFQGQYKSKLVCPVCDKVSITFDPFMHLSVPLPKKLRPLPVTFISKDPHRTPIRLKVRVAKDGSVESLKEAVQQVVGVPPANLRVFEVYKNRVHKVFSRVDSLTNVTAQDNIIVHEVLSKVMAGEPVVEVLVSQRTEAPTQFPTKCSNCQQETGSSGPRLRRCMQCLRAAYCQKSVLGGQRIIATWFAWTILLTQPIPIYT